MSAIWLACCSEAENRQVEREIEKRDASAQLLRMNDPDGARRMVRALPLGAARVVLVESERTGSVEKVVEGLVKDGCAQQIVVMTRVVDPENVARLFSAGATEVIAVGEGARTPQNTASERAEGVLVASGRDAPPSAPTVAAAGSADAGEEVPRSASAEEVAVADPPQEIVLQQRPSAGPRAEARGSQAARPVARTVAAPWARAPLVTAISGRGGAGKTTLVAALAYCMAAWGLRTALVDVDLMFGNAHALLGAEFAADIATIAQAGESDFEAAVERSAQRVCPGLTLWGPCAVPEQAELVAPCVGRLIDLLRSEADIVFADTSSSWGDAVAETVAQADRCLVVSDRRTGAVAATKRAIGLAAKLGVPRAKMVCVTNRFEEKPPAEEAALRMEMEAGLSSMTRIGVASDEAVELMQIGRMSEVLGAQTGFAADVKQFGRTLARELGCVIAPIEAPPRDPAPQGRLRIRFPWKQAAV